ncbi:MAG: hypothetical protein IBX61_09510 [Thermoleophilia bacterium]|nr:hypothetical protein [Thermoleophilia bacterium]
MAYRKAILGEGTPYEFDFNDKINTKLRKNFAIPPAEPNERGLRKKGRGVSLTLGDYERLIIPIPFELLGNTIAEITTKQSTLLKALRKPRNVFTWNPDPDVNEDVYFDTYASELDMPLDTLRLGFAHPQVDLLCDPQPYPAEATIFDTVAVLAQMDGEKGEWSGSGFYVDTNRYRVGSKSAQAQTESTSTYLQRDAATPIDLSGFLTTGWVTLWVYLDSVPAAMDHIRIWIGSETYVNRRWEISAPYGMDRFIEGWQPLFFNYNDPTAVNGTPNHTAIDYFRIEPRVTSGNRPSFNVDNMHITNGKVCNVRGQTPLALTVYDVDTEYPCGFKADILAGDKLDLAVADGEAGEWSPNSVAGVALVEYSSYYNDTVGPHSGEKFVEVRYVGDTAGGAVRNPTNAIDCSTLADQKAEFWLKAWPTPDITLEVRVGNDASNYEKKIFSIGWLSWGSWWTRFEFNVADMIVGAGTVNWNNPIDYVEFYFTTYLAQTLTIGIDSFSFYEAGAAIDEMYLSRAEDGVEALPGIPRAPLSSPSAPSISWTAASSYPNLAGTYGGVYSRYVVSTSELFIHPAELPANLYAGEHKLFALLRTSDTGGGTVRWVGYDAHSGEESYGEAVTVEYNSGDWQVIDLGTFSPPFDGHHRDATLADTFSIIGLGVKSAGSSKNWDINVYAVAAIGGGSREFTPVAGQRFMCMDTRYIDSKGFSQGDSSDYTSHSVQKRRTTGDLSTLDTGINNLLILARDSSDPDYTSSLDITRLTAVPRLKNGT